MLNKCQIIGRLGADPEMRYTANGAAVTNFSVATSRKWTDGSGERREETEWFRVQAWNKLAEVCAQYLAKGRLVYVEGRLQTRKWQDQQGIDRYTTELVAQEVKFLGGGNREGGGAPAPAAGGSGMGDGGGWGGEGGGGGIAGIGDIDPDDLPF